MEAAQHWEKVYRTKAPDEVSWYRPHLDVSLDLITRAVPDRDAAIIDVGAGEATLVDDLLVRGYHDVTLLDLSQTALDVARARLGAAGAGVTCIAGDVCRTALPAHRYDLWHDRAVFHFLTDPADRAAYVRQVARAVKPGGHVIVATFGPDGPEKCSGLEVMRYDPDTLHGQFGAAFRLVEHRSELHATPWGSSQQFTYCYCKIGD